MSNDITKRWELIKQAEQNAQLHKQALSLEDISNYWGSMTPEQQNAVIGGGGAAAVAGISTALMDDEEEGRAGRILRNTLLAGAGGAGAGYFGTQAYNSYSPAAQADEPATSTDAAPPVADDEGGDVPPRKQSPTPAATPATPPATPAADELGSSWGKQTGTFPPDRSDLAPLDETEAWEGELGVGEQPVPQSVPGADPDRTTAGGNAYQKMQDAQDARRRKAKASNAPTGPAALGAAASATLPPWMQAVGAAGQMAGPASTALGITPQLKSISRGLTDPSSAPPPAADAGWEELIPENLHDKKGSEAISFGQRMAKQAVGKKRNRRKVLIGPDGKASVRGGAKKKSVKKKTRKYKGNEKQGQYPKNPFSRFDRYLNSPSSSASPTGNMPGSWFPPKPPKAPTGGSPQNYGPGYNKAERKQPLPKHQERVRPADTGLSKQQILTQRYGPDRRQGTAAGASYRPKTHVDHPDFKKNNVGAAKKVVPGGGKPSPSAGGYAGWKKRNPGAAYGKFMNQFPDAKVTEKGYRTLDVPSRGLSSAAPQFPRPSGPRPRLFPIRSGNPFNR